MDYLDFRILYKGLADRVAIIFPTPLKMAGDLYTFAGKVEDPELLEMLSRKFDEIWCERSKPVGLELPATIYNSFNIKD